MNEYDYSRFTPAGWHTITPRIVTKDAIGLVQFLTKVFGASGSYPGNAPAVMKIGDSALMISEPVSRDEMSAFLYVYVPNVDEVYERAISAGAESIEEPSDLPYGDRRAMVKDGWGNTWQIATRLSDTTTEAQRTQRQHRGS
jgi:PhnB protein